MFNNNYRQVRSLISSASILVDSGEFDAAIASYQEALSLDPGNVAARLGLAEIYLADDQPTVALKLAQDAATLAPQDAFAWITLGKVYERVCQLEASLRAFQEAASLRPSHTTVHAHIASVAWDAGHRLTAELAAHKALSVSTLGHYKALVVLGKCALEAGANEQAVEYLERALAVSTSQSDIQPHLLLARAKGQV